MTRDEWSETVCTILIWALVALACLTAPGCGSVSPETRSAYALEVARCAANEEAIVDRRDTTMDEDVEAIRAERARCDAALSEIGARP